MNLCEEELASIFSDHGIKIKYEELPIGTFWISIKEENPFVAKTALTILIHFLKLYMNWDFLLLLILNVKKKTFVH